MRDILEKITPWWETGQTFGLATVTNTYRSAPRDPGAALAVSAGGEVIGSVSGGCVEGAVYQLSTDVAESGIPVLETYGVSDDDAFAVGLTCGGIIDIFVEPVNKDSFPELGEILAAVRRGEPVAVATVISGPGQIGARRVIWARTDGRPPRTRMTRTPSGTRDRPARWARTCWTRRWTSTPGACWSRG